MKVKTFFLAGSFLLAGCGGNSSFIDTSKLPDTYQCNYMKDVCKESQEFESKYQTMNSEDKKEFESLLMAYRKQCSDALDACKKSAKIK